ncbi:MAG TPA: short-chain dehydrogenase [Dehalococcoidia bacterium]|jgi:2-hydroxycyclohexanecarboxyl-CoA dehydrogenase|nr:short-chain dehydrogenase [Dehalococcoidia bacterium]|tara:strand:+ start:318 stop:1112 length:795 start_codon:yes stop_codon:yes gene_type:complete
MDLNLLNKHVIITGGGSNIGRAIAHGFGAELAKITIAELVQTDGERVAKEITSLFPNAQVRVIPTDITIPDQVQHMVAESINEFGAIDVLINNVGWTIDKLFTEKQRNEWEKEVQVNLWGPINCINAVLPNMIQSQSGSIVSIASDAGRMGEYREAVYSACKGGVIALSKSIARENGKFGIRANVVCPGLIVPPAGESISEESMWNEMRDIFTDDVLEKVEKSYILRRMGTAPEVANAVIFLASDAASFITGQTLSVSGGYTMI